MPAAGSTPILMDMHMPGLDGPGATRRPIRASRPRRRAARTPIYALTANVQAEDRDICLAAGMDDFLTKPLDRDDLEALTRADPAAGQKRLIGQAVSCHDDVGSRMIYPLARGRRIARGDEGDVISLLARGLSGPSTLRPMRACHAAVEARARGCATARRQCRPAANARPARPARGAPRPHAAGDQAGAAPALRRVLRGDGGGADPAAAPVAARRRRLRRGLRPSSGARPRAPSRSLRQARPKVVGTYRLLRQEVAERACGFYSAGEFDLAPLLAAHRGKRFLELGRSCVLAPYRSKRRSSCSGTASAPMCCTTAST